LGTPLEKDEATAARLERVAEIEARIDPGLRRRGRLVADLVTIAVAAPLMVALDLHVTRPFVMLSLLGAALALNHLVPLFTERQLRAERQRLLARSDTAETETSSGPS
jgi:hypothetical protein